MSTVKSILSNEKYKGDALLQKTYIVDYLTKKAKINEGEIPQYYVEGDHEAIITPEIFDAVQCEMENAGKAKNTTAVCILSPAGSNAENAEAGTSQKSGIPIANTAASSGSATANSARTGTAPLPT